MLTATAEHCMAQVLPVEPDGKIAYDLIPASPELGYCFGEACQLATHAIDAFRAFLHTFSGVRMKIVHAMLSNQCPYADEGGTFLADVRSVMAHTVLASPRHTPAVHARVMETSMRHGAHSARIPTAFQCV